MRELPGVLRSAALRFLVQLLLPAAELPLPAAAQFRTKNPAECGEKSPQEPLQTAPEPISAQSTAIPRGALCIFTDSGRIRNSHQPALPACRADSASAARNDLYRTLRNCILAAARTKAGVNSSGCQIRDGESGAFLR
jgi:hypothetical protein